MPGWLRNDMVLVQRYPISPMAGDGRYHSHRVPNAQREEAVTDARAVLRNVGVKVWELYR